MKKVSELYGIHSGSDVYVVGTGPSLRVFPKEFLVGKVTIGLNDAWRFLPVHYGITIHPDLYVPEFLKDEAPRAEITWISKYHKTKSLVSADHFRHAEEHFYFFESSGKTNSQPPNQPSDEGRMLEWVRHPSGDFLYLWSSISQTAVNLAANMGAKNVVLVGCDNDSLFGNHHVHGKPTRWKGIKPALRYCQYEEGLAEVRAVLRERGVNLISASPFLSSAHAEDDFRRLCAELGLPAWIPAPYDRSPVPTFSEIIDWYNRALNRTIRKWFIDGKIVSKKQLKK